MFRAEFFVAAGKPVAQPRKTEVHRGGKTWTIAAPSDHPVHNWRRIVSVEALPHRPTAPLTGPVRVELGFRFQPPKNAILCPKTDPHLRSEWCITKPDRDNVDKAVLDTLKRVGFYVDDCQVCAGEITKRYMHPWLDERAGVLVTIEELEP